MFDLFFSAWCRVKGAWGKISVYGWGKVRTIYKSIIVIIIETVEYNVSVRFFTSCDVLERKREREQYKIVFKSTRENDIRLACIIIWNKRAERTEREMVE